MARSPRNLKALLDEEGGGRRKGSRGEGRPRKGAPGKGQRQPREQQVPDDAPRAAAIFKPEGRTPNQRGLLSALDSCDGVIATGPAGTGKTYLAVAYGAALIAEGELKKFVACRPTTDAGESLGFLPGTLDEKLEPWMAPIFDAVDRTVGRQRRQAWQRAGVLEVCSFQHMQGRTFEDSFVLLDEAQNADNMQIETFLTRIGVGSRYALVGDPFAQRVGRGAGGLIRALQLMEIHSIPVARVELTYDDVQRHGHSMLWARAFSGDHAKPKSGD